VLEDPERQPVHKEHLKDGTHVAKWHTCCKQGGTNHDIGSPKRKPTRSEKSDLTKSITAGKKLKLV